MSISSVHLALKVLIEKKIISVKDGEYYFLKSGFPMPNDSSPLEKISSPLEKISSPLEILNYKKDNLKDNLKDRGFTPPTITEIEDYCKERHNRVNPHLWLAHYEKVGWMVGRNKMKNWRAGVRYWEIKDRERAEKSMTLDQRDELQRNEAEAKATK